MLRDFSLRDFGASLNTAESYTNESSQGKIGLYETVSKQKCTHLGMFLASELFVQNITLGYPTYFIPEINKHFISANADSFITPVIEYGKGYDVIDIVPRPFIQNTHDDLERNHYHTEAMKRSLKKQGLEVR